MQNAERADDETMSEKRDANRYQARGSVECEDIVRKRDAHRGEEKDRGCTGVSCNCSYVTSVSGRFEETAESGRIGLAQCLKVRRVFPIAIVCVHITTTLSDSIAFVSMSMKASAPGIVIAIVTVTIGMRGTLVFVVLLFVIPPSPSTTFISLDTAGRSAIVLDSTLHGMHK